MGDIQMNNNGSSGGALRKRNWDRHGREQHNPQHFWSTGDAPNAWNEATAPPPSNYYLSYRNGGTVVAADGVTDPINAMRHSQPQPAPPPPSSQHGDAKDLSFWTNVFFSNANDAPTALPPTPHKDRHHQTQRKGAVTIGGGGSGGNSSVVVATGLLMDSPTSSSAAAASTPSLTDLSSVGNNSTSVSVPTTSSSLFSYLYGNSGSSAATATASQSTAGASAASFDNTGRYAAIQSGIKRKNHLSKTSKNSSGPSEASERVPKTTDLFLLPSCSGGPIYSSLGMTDVSPCTDGSRFIQVSFCLYFFYIPLFILLYTLSLEKKVDILLVSKQNLMLLLYLKSIRNFLKYFLDVIKYVSLYLSTYSKVYNEPAKKLLFSVYICDPYFYLYI